VPAYPAAFPGCDLRRGDRPVRARVVHELRPLGACVRTRRRHREHVLHGVGPPRRRDIRGLGPLEWHIVRGTGRRRCPSPRPCSAIPA
jgi:hypothetical protein